MTKPAPKELRFIARLRRLSTSLPLRTRECDDDEVQRDRPLCAEPRYGEVIARISRATWRMRVAYALTSTSAKPSMRSRAASRHAGARPPEGPFACVAAARAAYGDVVRPGTARVSNASAP